MDGAIVHPREIVKEVLTHNNVAWPFSSRLFLRGCLEMAINYLDSTSCRVGG